jgi:hypothetical protein
MDLSPTWEAANCAVTQEFPQKVYYRTCFHLLRLHQLLVPTLGHISPVHISPSYLRSILTLFPYIGLGLGLGLGRLLVSFFLIVPPNSYTHPSSPKRATCPAHLIRFDLIIVIIRVFCEEHNLWSSRILLSLYLSSVQILSSAPCSQTPAASVVWWSEFLL